jgi:hypothetical protein
LENKIGTLSLELRFLRLITKHQAPSTKPLLNAVKMKAIFKTAL